MPTEWTARVWREFRAGNLTRAWRDVLLTLATFRGRDGMICPAHQTVASRTSLAAKTVERALHAARDLGLVTWSERRIRRGWRLVRSSNLYQLLVPGTKTEAGLRRPRTDRPKVRVGESKKERPSSFTNDRAARLNAARQFLALGVPVPKGWLT